MTDLLIVGEAPNRAGIGRVANTTRSGARLAELGARELRRTNLLQHYPGGSGKGAKFPVADGREAVARLERRTPKRVAFILLGKRVAAAFGVKAEYLEWCVVRGRMVVVVPHPSGINHWWNDAANREAAATFFRELMRGEP